MKPIDRNLVKQIDGDLEKPIDRDLVLTRISDNLTAKKLLFVITCIRSKSPALNPLSREYES